MNLPRIGRPAPDFKSKAVLNDKVFDISLSDYDNKYLVLLFYPTNYGYVCPTELIAFSDHIKEFDKINANIVGCSIESHYNQLHWLSMTHEQGGIRGIRIPLIADKSMNITKAYGVLNEQEGICYRAMFIIDDKGILRQITINDRPVGRNVSEAYRLIQAIQQADKLRAITPTTSFVEVTPSNSRKPRPLICSEKSLLREVIDS
ncbi:unnamed protein product [Adineta steineri]|uniref:thioredoxin-dependent peroxiredoxin n=1 Tax=Adineta steineri TaxID=433720 RepID=A0A818JRD5_9BILA|nr:unnamed protein product [Adineta steineri]CAF3540144.1 unnamed protein product [Adineta steineri]